jgi:hypothetical protein
MLCIDLIYFSYDGKYAENCVKQGVWIDILEKYIGFSTYSGEYKDGKPIG